MRRFVALKVRFLPKRLLTDRARKWTDVLVHSHVNSQVVGLCEDLATNLSILKFPSTCLIVYRLDSCWGGYSKFWSLEQLLLLQLLLLCLKETASQTDVWFLLDDRQRSPWS